MASSAGLVAAMALVSVGPPLCASSPSLGSTFVLSVGFFAKLHSAEGFWTRLWPFDDSAPAQSAVGKRITTIEGISPDGNHPIQVAWKEFDTPQCGYCQSGMIMSALALLQRRPNPSDAEINTSVTNACRCGTYHRIRQAIHLAADLMKDGRR